MAVLNACVIAFAHYECLQGRFYSERADTSSFSFKSEFLLLSMSLIVASTARHALTYKAPKSSLFGFELIAAVCHTSLQRLTQFVHHGERLSDSGSIVCSLTHRLLRLPPNINGGVCVEFIRFSSERTIRHLLDSRQLLVFSVRLSRL